jgi:hypothetical protein
VSYCRVDSTGRLRRVSLNGYDPGLGFSLKRPRWLRKIQPGIFLQKHALPIAAIGASFFIPGAAALAAKGLVGAGKLATGGARGLLNLARSVKAPKLPFHALQQATSFALPAPAPQLIQAAAPSLGPSDMVPVPSPAFQAASAGGGGGGGDQPDQPMTTAEQKPGMSGGTLALIAGAGLLLAMSHRRK